MEREDPVREKISLNTYLMDAVNNGAIQQIEIHISDDATTEILPKLNLSKMLFNSLDHSNKGISTTKIRYMM